MSQPFAVHWLNGIIAVLVVFHSVQVHSIEFLHKKYAFIFSDSLVFSFNFVAALTHAHIQPRKQLKIDYDYLHNYLTQFHCMTKFGNTDSVGPCDHSFYVEMRQLWQKCDKTRFKNNIYDPHQNMTSYKRKNNFTRFHVHNKWKTAVECRKCVDCFQTKAIQFNDYSPKKKKLYTNPFNLVSPLFVVSDIIHRQTS